MQQPKIPNNQFAQAEIKPPNFVLDPPIQKKQPSKQITYKIIDEIASGKLAVSVDQKRFTKKSRAESEQSMEKSRIKLIQQLRKNKQKTMQQLQDLQKKQLQIKKGMRSLSRKNIKKQRSSFTSQQKQKIKQILKQAKITQIKKKIKHDEIIQHHSSLLKKQKKQEEELIQKLRYEHKQSVEHNLINIELRKKQRQQSFKEVSLRMLELKRRKYIHQIKQQKDKQQQYRMKELTKQKLRKIKQRMNMDLTTIKKHQQQYKEYMQQKILQRNQRLKTQMRKPNTSRKYERNYFSQILQQEQKEKEKERLRKQNNAKQMRFKVNEFKQYVRQRYRPSKMVSPHSSSGQKQQKTVKSLSYQQIINQGNQNLKLAKKLRKEKDSPKMITEPQVVKYMDYLKTMRKKNSKEGTLQKFRTLVKNEQSLDFQSAYKAVSLVEEIEAKSKKTKDSKLLQTIQNKIDLLKVLL